MDKQAATRILVDTLRPFKKRAVEEWEGDYEHDEQIREIVRAALRELQCYDAGGCPLCLG
jgi:hypothetical protein